MPESFTSQNLPCNKYS